MTRPDRRTRSARLAVLTVALAAVAAACSSAATPAPTPAPTAAPTVAPTVAPTPTPAKGLVNLGQDAKLGAFLTGVDGKSLYLWTKDSKDKSTASANVLANWPPLLVTAADQATAGAGVTGTLATIKRDDGTTQVTYNGIPLYYYVKDAKAGDINGQALNGTWFLVPATATAASGAIKGGIGQDAAAASPAASTSGAANSVDIKGFAFSPASIKVAVGTTVKWTNSDSAAHTVTADGGTFDSKNLANGASFSQAFATAGTFTYKCTIHPSMTGSVVVGP